MLVLESQNYPVVAVVFRTCVRLPHSNQPFEEHVQGTHFRDRTHETNIMRFELVVRCVVTNVQSILLECEVQECELFANLGHLMVLCSHGLVCEYQCITLVVGTHHIMTC